MSRTTEQSGPTSHVYDPPAAAATNVVFSNVAEQRRRYSYPLGFTGGLVELAAAPGLAEATAVASGADSTSSLSEQRTLKACSPVSVAGGVGVV